MARYTKNVNANSLNTIRHMPGKLAVESDPHYGKIIYNGANASAVSPWMKKNAFEYHDITFNANGGGGYMAPTRTRSKVIAPPECTFTPPQYKVFLGWAYTADGPVIEEDFIRVEEDITLYAKWTPKIVTITFTPVSVYGEGTGEMEPVQVEAGTNYTLPACTFEHPDHMLFYGWGTKNVRGARPISTETIFVEEDTLLYAFWQQAAYLTLCQNSFAPPEEPVSTLLPLNTYDLPDKDHLVFPVPEGKEFVGWSDEDGLGGEIYDAVTLQTDLKLYAIYQNK